MRLIDAEALIRELNEKLGCRTDINKIICGMTVYEPAIVQPQWIPVTERLPETSQDVLITKRKEFGTVRVMKAFYMSSDDRVIWASQCGIDTTGVIAWMPLPEPYTPEMEENT